MWDGATFMSMLALGKFDKFILAVVEHISYLFQNKISQSEFYFQFII